MEPSALLNGSGQVTAVIIAIEDYQSRKTGQIPSVDYAIADATAFSAVLDQMFPDTEIHRIELIDSQATSMSVQDGVKQAIHSTGPDDLLIFYYAGHGFHNGIANLITVWDSNGHNLSGTCLNLRELIFDPVGISECQDSETEELDLNTIDLWIRHEWSQLGAHIDTDSKTLQANGLFRHY